MIYEWEIGENRRLGHLWFDTDDIEAAGNGIKIYWGMPGERDQSILHWRVTRDNVGSWMGTGRPSLEYFMLKMTPGFIDNTRVSEVLDDSPEVRQGFEVWTKKIFDISMRTFNYCSVCYNWYCTTPNELLDHKECEHCGTLINENQEEVVTLWSDINCNDSSGDEIICCIHCYDDINSDGIGNCNSSGRQMSGIERGYAHYVEDISWYCEYHYEQEWFWCDNCEIDQPLSSQIDGVCEDCYVENGGCVCPACAPGNGRYNGRHAIQEWDYRPALIFHPSVPTNPKKPLYIGMELETSFGSVRANWQSMVTEWYAHEVDSDLIYMKSDSSVRYGCEIVTHPMEPRWALKNFPFKAFDELIDKGALEQHESCGTHIHMNKEAFSSAHLWKFLQVHYRLPEFLKLLGGRQDGTYASFQEPDMERMRQEMMQIIKEKDKGQDYERYVAVNLRNQHTIELRYPASGTSSFLIKKNIELALALYEFSDYLTVDDIKDGALDDPGYLMHWIRSGNYPSLTKWLDRQVPIEKPLKTRSY